MSTHTYPYSHLQNKGHVIQAPTNKQQMKISFYFICSSLRLLTGITTLRYQFTGKKFLLIKKLLIIKSPSLSHILQQSDYYTHLQHLRCDLMLEVV